MDIRKADSKGRLTGFEPGTHYRIKSRPDGGLTVSPVISEETYQTEYEIYELVYSSMEPAIYSRGRKPIPKGEIIAYDDRRYKVRYSWEWMKTIYMAELEPLGKEEA